jgi:hypothetical protein
LLPEVVNVYGLIVEIHLLSPVDCDDHAELRKLFHGLRLWNVHIDAGLQNRRRNHENDEQDEDDVDERHHVDF